MLHDHASQSQPKYLWHRQTIAETYARITGDPEHPWLAIGDFLDDWRFTEIVDRPDLVAEPIALVDDDLELLRWGAFCAAMVERLCWQDGLPFPAWTAQPNFVLSDP